jgi:hypothetical protein
VHEVADLIKGLQKVSPDGSLSWEIPDFRVL